MSKSLESTTLRVERERDLFPQINDPLQSHSNSTSATTIPTPGDEPPVNRVVLNPAGVGTQSQFSNSNSNSNSNANPNTHPQTSKRTNKRKAMSSSVQPKVHLPHCEITIRAEQQRQAAANLQKAKARLRNKNAPSLSHTDEEKESNCALTQIPPEKKTRQQNSYVFGGVKFSSFKKAMDFCKDKFEGSVTEFYPGDRDFEILQDIFKRCEAYKELNFVAIGFKKGEKGKGPFCKYPSFYFKTDDHIPYPINYRECLRAKPTQVRIEPTYKTAFYNAIRVFLGKYRSLHFKKRGIANNTVLNGGFILTKKNSEVIYRGLSFDQILENFLTEYKLKIEDLNGKFMISPSRNKADLVDPVIKDQWIAYHAKFAVLDIVAKQKPTRQRLANDVPSGPAALTPESHSTLLSEGSNTNLVLPSHAMSEINQFFKDVTLPITDGTFIEPRSKNVLNSKSN